MARVFIVSRCNESRNCCLNQSIWRVHESLVSPIRSGKLGRADPQGGAVACGYIVRLNCLEPVSRPLVFFDLRTFRAMSIRSVTANLVSPDASAISQTKSLFAR